MNEQERDDMYDLMQNHLTQAKAKTVSARDALLLASIALRDNKTRVARNYLLQVSNLTSEARSHAHSAYTLKQTLTQWHKVK